MTVETLHGDCRDVLRGFPPQSFDAVVTDPPYGLEFLGEAWDRFAPAAPVLRNGWQHAATSAGIAEESGLGRSRVSYHRRRATWRCSTCGKRDGFRNAHGCPEDWQHEWTDELPLEAQSFQAWCADWAASLLRVLKPGGWLVAFGGARTWHRLACAIEDAGFELRDTLAWLYGQGFPKSLDVARAIDRQALEAEAADLELEYRFTAWARSTGVSAAAMDAATGSHMGGHYLTSASQPAIPTAAMLDALRPLFGEVPEWIEDVVALRDRERAEAAARNEGVGFLGSLQLGERDEAEPVTAEAQPWRGWGTALKPAWEPIVLARRPLGAGSVAGNVLAYGTGALNVEGARTDAGRWPPNVALDAEAAALLDVDFAGASRFFYCAKADGSERPELDGAEHPTVKPVALMRWLVRLVTPRGGRVLDPFAGSGTTGEACVVEGFDAVLIEREAPFVALIDRRLSRDIQPTLFSLLKTCG